MKKILAIIIVMILIAPAAFADSFGNLVGDLTTLFSFEDNSTSYAPGETACLDDYDITLTNAITSNGNSIYTPAEGNMYIIFEFSITNKTDEEAFISSMMCFSPSVDGKPYTFSLEANSIALLSGKIQFDKAIDPGKTQNGIVGYEIPKTWNEIRISVCPDIYGGDKATFVINP